MSAILRVSDAPYKWISAAKKSRLNFSLLQNYLGSTMYEDHLNMFIKPIKYRNTYSNLLNLNYSNAISNMTKKSQVSNKCNDNTYGYASFYNFYPLKKITPQSSCCTLPYIQWKSVRTIWNSKKQNLVKRIKLTHG